MNLEDLLSELGVDYVHSSHHHVSSGWIGIDCPQCSAGWKKYRLGINVKSGRATCWVCGSVNPVKMLAKVSRGVQTGQLIEWWRELDFRRGPKAKRAPLKPVKLPRGIGAMGPAHRRYVKSRQFDPDYVYQLWQVGGIGPHSRDEIAYSLFLPIHDQDGVVVSWTTRKIVQTRGPRYYTANLDESAVNPGELLYGEHLAQHIIFICEGPLDAWVWGPGGVASLGVSYSEVQVARMAKFPIRVVVFDSAPDAQKRAVKLCRQLAPFPGETHRVQLETGSDPASADRAEIEAVRQHFGIQ
jgi:hypothetical protein